VDIETRDHDITLLNMDNQALNLSISGPTNFDNKSSELQSPKQVAK